MAYTKFYKCVDCPFETHDEIVMIHHSWQEIPEPEYEIDQQVLYSKDKDGIWRVVRRYVSETHRWKYDIVPVKSKRTRKKNGVSWTQLEPVD